MTNSATHININRLMDWIENDSARVGGLDRGGICRLALTDEDKTIRDLFIQWMEDIHLKVRVDDFGNMYGRLEGTDPEAAPVVIGSHLDTQPEGGRYDGILGVLSGLEVLYTLRENNITPTRSIELICFTNEEGARFAPPILGAGGLANVFSKDFVYSRTDKDGKSFIDELKRIDYQGKEENRIQHMHSFIELHIEQGPVLEQKGLDIGVVTGIQGMNWLEVTVKGEADHAGPTPMNMRKDPMMASAAMMTEVRSMVVNHDDEATVTVGQFGLQPGSINCVPGEVTFTVDIRHSSDTQRESLVEQAKKIIKTIADQQHVTCEIHPIWETPSSHFSKHLTDQLSEAANQLGYSYQEMISGAGHDAKYINEMAPTAMIFVPSANGKSHCQEEFTDKSFIEKGANVLLNTVQQLTENRESIQ
ncbi:Zn-dependent hydrolase [Alteribacillus iranensis]|uniref:N-carbamoyl-L-amino-acid hydrolase n=1 Tax=Alteribacillus iranensis TaxID=930128 RepID=A0A1I2C6U1_9BACI|nr:Zn-dependent hydrolase [Alteribacillus iranensis]SFE63898.1 N-carbamoyl-L-amino-acid hydrolase [Alteribacillus iranensis]